MKACPACGEENPDRARVCMICGTQLAEAPAPRRERRIVSVLFADLVGFTSRSERLDVEEVAGFLGPYHRLLRRELERHGGTVEKFIGDAVMALFGAPVAHEDDAERAVRAALAIQTAIAELRERDDRLDLHVRVGVTTGEALVVLRVDAASGEGLAAGDVVNTAARLQAAAPVDGVLVDEPTRRATERSIDYAPAGAVAAKGKSEAVAASRALRPRSRVPLPRAGDELPLVGREHELALLRATLERARGEPSMQLVTLVGAPGIGKTRLVAELAHLLEQEPTLTRWRRGRSLSYGDGIAFWALGEMVKSEAGILESDGAEQSAARLDAACAALLGSDEDAGWIAGQLRPLIGVDEVGGGALGAGREAAFAAWRRFFEAMAEAGPTVLVFEDLHWADEALLDFVELLADDGGALPLMVVCTARPELLARRPGWSGGRMNAATLNLSGLSGGDTAQLVGLLLDDERAGSGLEAALLAPVEGNPLYAQEYVRMLRDQGLLVRDVDGWRLEQAPARLPESVQVIIASRLDTLAEAEKRLVQDAAVIGRTAWLGAVAAVAGEVAAASEDLLRRVERTQLLRRARRSSVAGEVELGFAHALIQDVAYGQIPRAERAEKHERAAAWIEQLAGERDDKAELLAHHYRTALELRHATGGDTAALRARAAAALMEAGRQAQALSAHAAAARHLEAALDLLPEDDPKRPRLLLDRAYAAYHAGMAAEAILQEAVDAQVAAEDWEAAGQASRMLGEWYSNYAGDGARAREADARGLEYALRGGYTPSASLIAYAVAFRLFVSGRYVEGLEFTAEWMRRAQMHGDEPGRALVLHLHGTVLGELGEPEQGNAEIAESARVLGEWGHPKAATFYKNHAEGALVDGKLDQLAESLAEARRWARRYAQALPLAAVDIVEAIALFHTGRWDDALRLCEPIIRHPAQQIAAFAVEPRCLVSLARGETTVAGIDAEDAIRYGRQAENLQSLFAGMVLCALVHDATGSAADAVRACDAALARWNEVGGLANMAHALAYFALLDGREEAVGHAASTLHHSNRWKRPLLFTAEGRHVEAAAAFADIGSKPLEAAAWLRAARAAERSGEQLRAREHAQRALRFWESVGADVYARRALRITGSPVAEA